MKRRDLLKGLLAIPAALLGAKAVKAEPRLLDVTNLGTPNGDWKEGLVFSEPVFLDLQYDRLKITNSCDHDVTVEIVPGSDGNLAIAAYRHHR